MIQVDDAQFQALINRALEELPRDHINNIKNVAILYEEEPTAEQRQKAQLKPYQTLLGLYEGTPLSERQGLTKTLPDKITLFTGPLKRQAGSPEELKESIKHTLWHEVAHYYGLNHHKIHELEQ